MVIAIPNNYLSLINFKVKIQCQRLLFLNKWTWRWRFNFFFLNVVNIVSRGVLECHVGSCDYGATWDDIQLAHLGTSLCQNLTKINHNTIATCTLANCPHICPKTYIMYLLICLECHNFLYRKYNQTPPHHN